MDIQKITSCLNKNKITYNKNLLTAIHNSSIEEYSNEFDTSIEKLKNYVAYGLNNGFNNNVNECINKCTNIIVDISNEKNSKNRTKIEQRIADCDKLVSKFFKCNNVEKINTAEKVLEYINAYKSSLIAVIENQNVVRKEVLIEAQQKLEKLEELVSNEGIVCTNEAYDYAKKIVQNLKEWAKMVANNMHTEKNNENLDNAISYANEWSKLDLGICNKLFKKNSNLATDISEINFVKDAFSEKAISKETSQRIQMFAENLENYKIQNEQAYNIEEKESDLLKDKQKLKDLENEQEEIYVKKDNGLIEDDDFVSQIDRINEEIQYYNEKIETSRGNIIVDKMERDSFKKVIDIFNQLNTEMKGVVNNSLVLNYLAGEIDFDKIYNILNGYATNDDIAYVCNLSVKINEFKVFKYKRQAEIVKGFNYNKSEIKDRLNEIKKENKINKEPVQDDKLKAEELMKKWRERNNKQTTIETEEIKDEQKTENLEINIDNILKDN